MSIGKLAAPVGAALLLGAVQPAHAESPDRSMLRARVSAAGLDLSRPGDGAAMLKRIQHAARFLCESQLDPWDLSMGDWMRSCTREATSRAVAALDRPTVSAALTAGPDANLRLAAR